MLGGQDGTAKSTSVSGGAADEDDAEGEGPKIFTSEVILSEGSKLLFKETAKLFLKHPDKVRNSVPLIDFTVIDVWDMIEIKRDFAIRLHGMIAAVEL